MAELIVIGSEELEDMRVNWEDVLEEGRQLKEQLTQFEKLTAEEKERLDADYAKLILALPAR